jgi:sugar/nucleoside kinase (ribokinase family)
MKPPSLTWVTMISVIGEALVDLVMDVSAGDLAVRPGGGPYNTARTLARLGVREPSGLPTTLAIADVAETRSARYSFYLTPWVS